MSRKLLTRSALALGLLAPSGCCSWCERHCQQKQPVVCQPAAAAPVCYAPPAAYPAVPASPPAGYIQQPPVQTYNNLAPQTLVRNPANNCYCPQ